MSQTSKVSGVKTKIIHVNGYTIIRYHSTDVVTFNSSEIILNTKGWRTVTTKLRMNQASNQFNLGFTVFQKNFEWYIKLPHGDITSYYDNMTIKRVVYSHAEEDSK